MEQRKFCVYCAGPLFNNKEQEEMEELATACEDAGFDTFLPQRDGLELAVCVQSLVEKGVPQERASASLSRAIFALDVYQVIEACHAVIVNLNGRVPDEGAVSEAALAWCSGKALFGYKADHRSVFGGQDNPLVTGLFNFQIHSTKEGLISALLARKKDLGNPSLLCQERRDQLRESLEYGRRIWEAVSSDCPTDSIAEIVCEGHVTAGA